MTNIPDDIRHFFHVAASEPGSPMYYLWVFDPETGQVVVTHNEGVEPVEHQDHDDLAQLVKHPNRLHGYAYRIRGGWRITDWEHKPVGDPYITKQVVKSLDGAQRISKTTRTYDPR